MNDYYKECLEKGLEYQDFVTVKMAKELGIIISNFSSKQYQYNIGENQQGIEIKFDDKYKETGNLYIETSEKSCATMSSYTKSGIYRNDNTWLYLIGNYESIFIFGKKILQIQCESKKYRKVVTPTSKGFLLDDKGQKTALKIIKCSCLKGGGCENLPS